MDNSRRTAFIVGVLFILTFITAIAGRLLYGPVLDDPNYIVSAGADTQIAFGALFELLLIIANVGTALWLFPILKRGSTKRSPSAMSQLVSSRTRSSRSASSVSLRS